MTSVQFSPSHEDYESVDLSCGGDSLHFSLLDAGLSDGAGIFFEDYHRPFMFAPGKLIVSLGLAEPALHIPFDKQDSPFLSNERPD